MPSVSLTEPASPADTQVDGPIEKVPAFSEKKSVGAPLGSGLPSYWSGLSALSTHRYTWVVGD
jgi:hypothetical protein